MAVAGKTKKGAAELRGKPAGKPASKPAGEPASKAAGKPAGKPAGKLASKPEAKPVGKPAAGRGYAADRGARRRRETRAKLLRAAHSVMARKGIDATTLQEITEAADVAFGSFYNHFASKEAIVDALMSETVESFGDLLDHLADTLEDPAEVVAASIRYTVAKAIEDETWGWFLVRSGIAMPAFRFGLMKRLARDIRIAIKAGRCRVDDLDAVVFATGGTVLSIVTARLRGEMKRDAPERAATLVMRLLGLGPEEAAEIVSHPLPALATAEGDEPGLRAG